MPFALFSSVQGQRISDVFASEKEMWAYVRANGYCYEAVDRDDREPSRVLFPAYSIYVCGEDGQRLNDTPIRRSMTAIPSRNRSPLLTPVEAGRRNDAAPR